MSLTKQEFTNAGRDMLTSAQGGATLHITKIVVGSGAAAVPGDLWPLTALITHEMDVSISSVRNLGNGQLMVEGDFRSTDAPHAFYEREVGIMAHIDSGTDALYSVANVFADPPNYIDPAAPTIRAYKIKLIVDRVDPADITVTISPTEAITGLNLGPATDGPGVYQSAAGNVLKFKRLVAGDGIDITQDGTGDDDATEITIAQRVLKTNVDLYVPLTYPGITDPDVLFPTVQAAHDYLQQFHIPADKTATIHVYSGHFANAAPINFAHPDASRIVVTGLPIVAKALRPATSITRTGSLPNLSIALNLSDASGIAVNDVVYLHDAPHPQLESVGLVTSIVGTVITIAMRIANVLPPSSNTPLSTTRLIVFPTQFTSSMTANTPIFNCPNGINRIKNFGCRSTVAQAGQVLSILSGPTVSAIEHAIAYGFALGFGIGGQVQLWPIVAANNCSVGIQIGPAGTAYLGGTNPVGGYKRFTWSGNVTYGLWATGGSYVSGWDTGAGAVTFACSNGTGIRSDVRAWVGVGDDTPGNAFGLVVGYNDQGCVAALLGVIQSALATLSACQVNVSLDFHAQSGAHISFTHNASMPPSGQFSPANNTLGGDGAYISVASP